MQNRRSRMRRTRTGKKLALTARDIAIFRWLTRYRYLRSTYLHAFVGGVSVTRFKERLGDLFHEGFIDRPERQWEFAQARHQPVIYEIGERAARVLDEQGRGEAGVRTYLGPTAHRQFPHSVMVCECLASIEIATLARPNLRFIPWSDILARAPETTRRSPTPYRIPVSGGSVIPDAIFGLEYRCDGRRAYRFFALEADRGTMPVERSDARQTSLLGKYAVYDEVFTKTLHKTYLGLSTLLVLTVLTEESRQAGVLSGLIQMASAPQLLFKISDGATLAHVDNLLLTDPWLRPSAAPLPLATP